MDSFVADSPAGIVRRPSVCPHDCPSVCALDVEVIDGKRIGRVHGAEDQRYTAGVVCAKVARYAERIHHPDRLTRPLHARRAEGLRPVRADRLGRGARPSSPRASSTPSAASAPKASGPIFTRGTMGLVMRDGLERLTHAKRYSRFFGTICVGIAWPGYLAGTGRMAGADPREMAKSDCHRHLGHQRRRDPGQRDDPRDAGAKGARREDRRHRHLRHRDDAPGRSGAAPEARHGRRARLRGHARPVPRRARRPRLSRALRRRAARRSRPICKTRDAAMGERDHRPQRRIRSKTSPRWSGATSARFFRLGYGFSRQRNGAANMHAALCVPVVSGAWAHEGGGAFHSNSGVFKLDKTMIEGLDARDASVRRLDQSRVGAVLTGDARGAEGRRPGQGDADPEHQSARRRARPGEGAASGFARDDLFVCVHEQFLTDTARYADIVLPATMFLEHDDLYTGGGHQYLQFGPKTIEPPEGCRSNHEVVVALAERLGARHPGFAMSPREIIDWTLRASGRGTLAELEAARWLDCQPPFEEAHFLNGFAYARRQVPLPRRLALDALFQRRPQGAVARDADPARPLAGQRGRRRRRIRSSSRLRRRAISSIRASPRRRPRAPAKRGRRR